MFFFSRLVKKLRTLKGHLLRGGGQRAGPTYGAEQEVNVHRRFHTDDDVQSGDSSQDRVVVRLLPLKITVQGPTQYKSTMSVR